MQVKHNRRVCLPYKIILLTLPPRHFRIREPHLGLHSFVEHSRVWENLRQLRQWTPLCFVEATYTVKKFCIAVVKYFSKICTNLKCYNRFYILSSIDQWESTQNLRYFIKIAGGCFSKFSCEILKVVFLFFIYQVMEATRSNWTSLYFVAAYILVNMVIMKWVLC